MKKGILVVVFMCIVGVLNAQEKKPTKEETIAFINRTLNEFKGYELPWSEGILESVKFTGSMYVLKTYHEDEGKRTQQYTTTCEDLPWDKLNIEKTEWHPDKNVPYYYVIFNQSYKSTEVYDALFDRRYDKTTTQMLLSLILFVPANKAESIKKAFLRLAEIAKEENKDPFVN